MIKRIFSLFLLIFVLSFPISASAQGSDVNNFLINEFKTDYSLDNSVKGGSLETTELINVSFTANNHGILRAIPSKYNGYDTKLKIKEVTRNGQPEKYTTYGENDNTVLKIGDAVWTVTGLQSYKITYTQERIVQFKNDGTPEFFWDVNGTQWQQRVLSASATLRVKDEKVSSPNVSCYKGQQGSTSQDCTVEQLEDGVLVAANNLKAGETLTLRTDLTGKFEAVTFIDKIADNMVNIFGFFAALSVGLLSIPIWYKYGRDYKGRGVIVPEYEAPDGLSPAEVSLLNSYAVATTSVSATIIDFAVRGYIRIHENTSQVLMFKSKKYSLELLKTDFTQLKEYEQTLIKSLFAEPRQIGQMVEMSKLDRTSMLTTFSFISKQLTDSMYDKYEYFEKQGKKYQHRLFYVLIPLFLAALFLFLFTSVWGFVAGATVSSVIVLILQAQMLRRSPAGVEAYEKVKGLKLYMDTVEKDRLQKMQSVERPYAEPTKTVELYEKLLPVAVALGVEKSWSQQFDGLLTQPPSWYAGSNVSAFNAGYFASSIGEMSSSFNSSFVSNSSSSGSSGGSAGGGGGGGGGGGW